MRAISLLLILALAVGASAQNVNLSKKIKIKPGSYRLDSLLKQVSKSAGVTFSFDTKKINAGKSVKWTSEETTVKEALAALEEQFDVEIIQLDNHIVLVSRPKPKPNETAVLIQKSGLKKDDQKAPSRPIVSPTSLSPSTDSQTLTNDPASLTRKIDRDEPKIDSIKTDKSENKIDSIKTIEKSVAKDSATSISPDVLQLREEQPQAKDLTPPIEKNKQPVTEPQKKPTTASDHKTTTTNPPKKIKKETNTLFFIRSGLAVNEIMYSNVVLQVGLPIIYGSISAGTNFKFTELRYGAGSRIKLNDNWSVNAQLDFGKTSRTFNPDSLEMPIDTATSISVQNVKVTGKLFRLNILFEKALTKNLTLQIGPTFNVLKTEYAVNNKTSEIGGLGTNADKKYRTISAPYLISNTYDANSSSNIKVWVGAQVGLIFTIKNWSKK